MDGGMKEKNQLKKYRSVSLKRKIGKGPKISVINLLKQFRNIKSKSERETQVMLGTRTYTIKSTMKSNRLKFRRQKEQNYGVKLTGEKTVRPTLDISVPWRKTSQWILIRPVSHIAWCEAKGSTIPVAIHLDS